jgi:hypothetical protein
MKNKINYFKELQKYEKTFQGTSFMCNYECFMMDFDENIYLPFNNKIINYLFPVAIGTKYANGNALSLDKIEALGRLSQISESSENHYEEKINHVLSVLSDKIFKEQSLFLLKEHCKLFSPYSEKAKELLKKLESLK